MKTVSMMGVVALLTCLPSSSALAASCESLAKLALKDTAVTKVEVVAAGSFQAPDGPPRGRNPYLALAAFCRVVATLTPTSDSDIKVEVWLPTSGWNGKFQAVGNGGWAGVISYAEMAEALQGGYATASTDTGHVGGRGTFALGHPEKLVDFAWRSEHEMTARRRKWSTPSTARGRSGPTGTAVRQAGGRDSSSLKCFPGTTTESSRARQPIAPRSRCGSQTPS